MPRLVLVGHSTLSDDLVALDATSGELLLVAAGAEDLLLPRDEALGADGRLADYAAEALLVPLARLVLHLLGSSAEDLSAAVAAGSELRVIAVAAVDLVYLGAELLVHQRHAALGAQEARLVPVLVLVGQILGVDSDDLVALLASVGEDALVALDAVGVVIAQHVALARQRLVALPAAEVPRVPVLVHGLGVLAAIVGRIALLDLRDGDLATILGLAPLAAGGLLDLPGLCCGELYLYVDVGHRLSLAVYGYRIERVACSDRMSLALLDEK